MSADFEMYLDGDEDGQVRVICTARGCMSKGQTTPTNPEGLWLQPVDVLPYHPTPDDVRAAWDEHLRRAHPPNP